MPRVKVVGPSWTAYLSIDDTGTCIEADKQLVACKGHGKGALRTYFARQGWTATILVSKPAAPPVQVPVVAPPGITPAVMAHPLVAAILAAFPDAVVRPLR